MYFMYIRVAAQGVFPRSLSIWRTILEKFSEQLYMHIQRRNTSRKAARKRTPSLTKKYKRLRRVVAKLAHKAQ